MRGWLLLLLHDKPAHGYELGRQLEQLQFDSTKTRVYRNLRWLADSGFINPDWQAPGRGPARRVYSLSDDGLGVLELLTPHLRMAAKALDPRTRSRVLKLLDSPLVGMQTFGFTVRARVKVAAGSDDAARGKVERMLRRASTVDPAVRADGPPHIGCPIRADALPARSQDPAPVLRGRAG